MASSGYSSVIPPRPSSLSAGGVLLLLPEDSLTADSGYAQQSAITWSASPHKPELECSGLRLNRASNNAGYGAAFF